MKHIPKKSSNISCIVADGMCTGCGFCVAFCPHDALIMIKDHMGFNMPALLHNKCNDCGLCFDLCPGYGLNRGLPKYIDASFYNQLLGWYIKVYLGHARDTKVRLTASSGGIATMLLLYMLEKGYINGAVVVVMSYKNPLHAEAVIATSKEDILRATGSKYTPVTMNEVLRLLMRNGGRLAFVGLPCHIEALRKAEKRFSKLKNSIILRIGLYCGNMPSVLATKYLLWLYKIPMESVRMIRYRGDGWPGYLTISLKDKEIKVPFIKYYDSGFGHFFCKKKVYSMSRSYG